jgi:hypothetical protein
MRLGFCATTAHFEGDEYALVCGVADAESYLALQRDSEDSDEDWGIHLEYGDQSNGDYERVARCRLTRQRLEVDLSAQLGALADVEGFDVDLAVTDAAFQTLRDGLRQVFRGKLNQLQIG